MGQLREVCQSLLEWYVLLETIVRKEMSFHLQQMPYKYSRILDMFPVLYGGNKDSEQNLRQH